MYLHVMEGEPGCVFAREHRAVAVVVDALRASTTAAMLLDAGAVEILAVREVEEAFAARRDWPDALLYGERGGLPPEGFDYGNSPVEAVYARGRRVVFTTTTGAGRLVQAWGAAAVMMGAPVNAQAVSAAAFNHAAAAGGDIVLIPAGLMDDPDFDAQEDYAAAVFLAQRMLAMNPDSVRLGPNRELYDRFAPRLADEGLLRLFETAPHAEKLRRIHKESEIPLCAQVDVTAAVPLGVARHVLGVLLRRG